MLSDPHDSATGPAVDRGAARLPLERSWTGADRLPRPHAEAPRGWWHDLPELVSDRVRVRELRLSDAPSLAETLASPQVSRYISPGPGSFVETEEFIVWARRARLAGRYICFGVVPPAATQRSASSSSGRSTRASAPPSGGSPSGRGSGAPVCSKRAPGW